MNTKRPAPWGIVAKISKVKDKERILKAAGKQQRATYKQIWIRLSADFSAKTCRPEGRGMIYIKLSKEKKLWKGKSYNLRHSTQQDYHSKLKERQRTSQINKN